MPDGESKVGGLEGAVRLSGHSLTHAHPPQHPPPWHLITYPITDTDTTMPTCILCFPDLLVSQGSWLVGRTSLLPLTPHTTNTPTRNPVLPPPPNTLSVSTHIGLFYTPDLLVSLGSWLACLMESPKSVALRGLSGSVVRNRKLSGLTSR